MPFTENTPAWSIRGREPNSEGCWLVSGRNAGRESVHNSSAACELCLKCDYKSVCRETEANQQRKPCKMLTVLPMGIRSPLGCSVLSISAGCEAGKGESSSTIWGAWGLHPASPAALQELSGPVTAIRECEALSDIGIDKCYPEISRLPSEKYREVGKVSSNFQKGHGFHIWKQFKLTWEFLRRNL